LFQYVSTPKEKGGSMAGRRGNGAGSLYRRDGIYYAKFVKGGKVKRKSLGTADRSEAMRRLQAIANVESIPDERVRADVVRRVYAPKISSVNLANLWGMYEKTPECASMGENGRCNGARRFNNIVERLRNLGVCKVSQVDDSAVAAFIEDARKVWMSNTLSNQIMLMSKVWRVLEIEPNVWKRVRLLRDPSVRKRAFTANEIKRVIEMAEGEYRGLFLFGLFTGLRLRDCARMKWDMIDFDKRLIVLRPIKTARTSGRFVYIPMHSELESFLRGVERIDDVYVLPGLARRSGCCLSITVRAFLDNLGMDESVTVLGRRRALLSFHSLRSTFISWMAESGASLALVQSIVGHVSPEMTQRYYRRDDDVARRAIERFPSIFGDGEKK
jgi:integrase